MSEIAELKHLILEMKTKLDLFVSPGDIPISHIAKRTGKTRQAVREYLVNHYEPGKDFFKKNGKICVSEEVAIQLLQRR